MKIPNLFNCSFLLLVAALHNGAAAAFAPCRMMKRAALLTIPATRRENDDFQCRRTVQQSFYFDQNKRYNRQMRPLQAQTEPDTTQQQQQQSSSSSSSSSPSTRAETIQVEAESALRNVGWSLPEEGALTANDPFVQAIDAGIQADFGVALDDLLNPAKVVNLERDLYALRQQLAQATGVNLPTLTTSTDVKQLVTSECDGGGGGAMADELRRSILKKEAALVIERRSVFRGWLKTVFLVQAILSFGLSYVMATHPEALFGGFDWYYSYNMDVSISVLGYWWWWLFVVPSLRSRRPKGMEKRALDIAFVASPAISLLAPVVTKDTGIIWGANLAVVAASYAYSFLLAGDDEDEGAGRGDDDDGADTPGWLKFIFKSLDFGSGRERGARK